MAMHSVMLMVVDRVPVDEIRDVVDAHLNMASSAGSIVSFVVCVSDDAHKHFDWSSVLSTAQWVVCAYRDTDDDMCSVYDAIVAHRPKVVHVIGTSGPQCLQIRTRVATKLESQFPLVDRPVLAMTMWGRSP